MNITPTTTTVGPPTMTELATALMIALAEIRQVTVAELETELAGGDLEIASPEAVAAIATLETGFGRRLARVEDLEPERLTSVMSLADLLYRRWPAATPLPAREEP
jgi:hypothetical protein